MPLRQTAPVQVLGCAKGRVAPYPLVGPGGLNRKPRKPKPCELHFIIRSFQQVMHRVVRAHTLNPEPDTANPTSNVLCAQVVPEGNAPHGGAALPGGPGTAAGRDRHYTLPAAHAAPAVPHKRGHLEQR